MIYTIDYFLIAFIFYGFLKAVSIKDNTDEIVFGWSLVWPFVFIICLFITVVEILGERKKFKKTIIIELFNSGWRLK